MHQSNLTIILYNNLQIWTQQTKLLVIFLASYFVKTTIQCYQCYQLMGRVVLPFVLAELRVVYFSSLTASGCQQVSLFLSCYLPISKMVLLFDQFMLNFVTGLILIVTGSCFMDVLVLHRLIFESICALWNFSVLELFCNLGINRLFQVFTVFRICSFSN